MLKNEMGDIETEGGGNSGTGKFTIFSWEL